MGSSQQRSSYLSPPWRGEGRAASVSGGGAWLPLYSGLFTASNLHDLGLLEGDDAAIRLAERLFAGPEPYMPDRCGAGAALDWPMLYFVLSDPG